MNIYSKKQRWKVVLVFLATVIVFTSLWYTNQLVKKIAKDERSKLELWAKAVQKKAKLVRFTGKLFEEIKKEERKKAELYAHATEKLATVNFTDLNDISFILEVIQSNTTVPVILTNEENIIGSRNLDSLREKDNQYLNQQLALMKKKYPPIEIEYYKGKKNYLYYSDSRVFAEIKLVFDSLTKSFISEVASNTASVPVIYTDYTQKLLIASGNIDSTTLSTSTGIQERIQKMKAENKPIEIDLGDGIRHFVFYEESNLLKQLTYYPYIQFSIIGIFLVIAYSIFSTARKSEQNQVWVGMSKETAHQLGTPLSSLMAWVEVLKMKGIDEELLNELNRDIDRLNTITERFSKIGSAPVLQNEPILSVLEHTIDYIKIRSSKNVIFQLNNESPQPLSAKINIPLFEWVIENICKNAIDAMNGKGTILISVVELSEAICIDISDTGKGIPKSKMKAVFEPGFTTKKRGWGLGLSLCKRIIENYHNGKIFVKKSELNVGTTFRILLKK